jgi:adenylyltransferase/sulfurtransferase
MTSDRQPIDRFARQIVFEPWGIEAQRSLSAGRALIVGVGGIGSWSAALLARAGAGFLRLVDDDVVDLTNLHRQALYDQFDAEAGRPKVTAAARRLGELNSACTVDAVLARADRANLDGLARDVDVIVDGTDNFATRFLINDYCVKTGKPWVFAGVIGAEAQVAAIVPGRTACLRCFLDEPPPPCSDPTCRQAGVMGMPVAAVAALQAMEAAKILARRLDAVSPHLLKLDLWNNTFHRMALGQPRQSPPCPCCIEREFEYLEP